ncbi:MAG TPA: hypothetical protein VJR50_27550 [Mycobacterium sp.]|nr:hypothetical protein [Mycobacterium sp.]
MKFAALGAAAVTTTALTVAVVPETEEEQSRAELLRLLADIRPFGTDPQAIPDLTGGLGSSVYGLSESGASQFLSLGSTSESTFPDVPGLNLITTGPLFGLLSLFGIDYGRVPALPSSIANEIEGTPFVTENFKGIGSYLTSTQEALAKAALTPILLAAGVPLREVGAEENKILGPIDDLADVRVIPVVGVGLGAFAAGQAHQQVSDNWSDEPIEGGSVAGSYTILPMVLLFNPGRANGGPLARAYPLFRLVGIDTVTPETHVQSDGGTAIGGTGLALGGDNLVPIKIDIGVQNFPASDFAAWPNPVTLANNGAALLFPTYIIRGFDEAAVEQSLEDQTKDQLDDALASRPLALNFYLTVPIKGAPVLEPSYLAVDAVNLLTGGQFNNPIGTALNPVLESAGNLGYTDVERQLSSDGTHYEYVRTFDDTGTPTAFFSFPDVDWEKVPGDLVTLLGVGLREALEQGIEGEPSPNAIAEVLKLLGLDTSSSAGSSSAGLSSLTDGLVGNALGSSLGMQAQNAQTTSFAPPAVNSPTTGSGQTQTVQLTQGDSTGTTPSAAGEDDGAVTPSKRPVAEIIERLGNSVTPPRTTAAAGTGTPRAPGLGDAVKQASDGVKKTVESVNDGVTKAVSGVTKAVTDTAKKMGAGAKPKPESDAAE